MAVTDLCKQRIKEYQDSNSKYRLANNEIYRIVSEHPKHTSADEIVTKTWIIGRTYAAAIERRNNKDETPGDFYYDYVAPALMKMDEHQKNILDEKINGLKKIRNITERNLPNILSVHKYLVDLFKDLTKKEKRSLASKYLHFHVPKAFFIYDSRVSSVITKFAGRNPRNFEVPKDSDEVYAKYCYKALKIYNEIKRNQYSDSLTRVVDNILLRYCDENNIEGVDE